MFWDILLRVLYLVDIIFLFFMTIEINTIIIGVISILHKSVTMDHLNR